MTGEGNWTWFVPGRIPTLIDAGVGQPGHLDSLLAALGGATTLQVLVTHGHSDHASGAPAIAARVPGARFLKMPWPARDGRWAVPWAPLADGDPVDVGDERLTVVHTPGHAPDHLCFWHASSRTLFGGDLAIDGTTVWIPSTDDGDLHAYMASLDRILALDPLRIYPAHGPVIADPARLLRQYIAHRARREAQILEAIGAGDERPEAIVARVYAALDGELRTRARETVIAHLRKLERGGRVRRTDDAWHIIDS